MASISRVRVEWSNFPGAPGVSTHYLTGTDYAALAPLNAFYESMKGFVPSGIVMTVRASGDIIDADTGALQGQWQHGTDTQHVGTGAGVWSAAQGIMVRWNTSLIHRGRFVKGRTFFVPVCTSPFSNNGQLSEANRAQLQGFVDTLTTAAAGELAVYSRPVNGSGGVAAQVTTGTVPVKPCVLRSRRD